MKKELIHKHHITPKHIGGTDDYDNIVKLTISEHAAAHLKLYEEYGRWQDKLAWKGLSGQIGRQEIIREIQKRSGGYRGPEATKKALDTKRRKGILHRPSWNDGLTKETDSRMQKASDKNKHYRELGVLSNIGDVVRGTTFSRSHKDKLSFRAKHRQKIRCEYCSNDFTPGMYTRWHGNNCKDAGR